MKSYITKVSMLSLAAVAVLSISGCGGGGSSSSTSDDSAATKSLLPYSGNRTLSGSVQVTSLNQAPSLKKSISFKADGSTSTELVKLYVLDTNGVMKDTNITCPVNTDHTYTCSNIAGDQEYIVRYVKDLGNGQVYEMKTSVSVGNEDVTGEKISKITTLIVSAIDNAVKEGLASVSSVDEETVKKLMKTIKESIKKSVVNLIKQGVIAIPDDADMVVTLPKGETFEQFSATTSENDKFSKVSGTVLSDKAVATVLDSSKNQVKLENYANMSPKEIISEVFKETGDGAPNWVVDFLADNYNHAFSVADSNKNIIFKANNDEWVTEDLARMGIAVVEGDMDTLVDTINAGVQNNTLLNSFKDALSQYKTAKDDNNATALADFPPIIAYLFPDGTVGDKFENVAQTLVYIMYAEGVYAKDVQKTFFSEKLNDDAFTDKFENLDIVSFEPKFILEELGLKDKISKYDKAEVDNFGVNMQSDWSDGDKPKEFATFNADFSKASWMMGGFTFDKAKLKDVTLTYPTKKGDKKLSLDVDKLYAESWGDGFDIEYSPWKRDCTDDCQPDESMMNITDNISGDYTMSATYNGEKFEKTFHQFVLRDATKYSPKLISPLAAPQWPQELQNTDWVNLTPAQQKIVDTFNKAQDDYMQATGNNGYVTFATNTDTDSDDVNDSIKDLLIQWDDSQLKKELSALNLPENIVPAYQVGVSLYEPDMNGDGTVTDDEKNQCMMNWDECNTEIFNTWWSDRPIKTNSIILPVVLPQNSREGRYQAHVDLVFIDKDSGNQVAQGGNSYSEFKVGTVAELSGSENIIFNGNVVAGEGTQLPTNLKVGFVANTCTFDADTLDETCTSKTVAVTTPNADGNYTLSVNAKALKTDVMNGGVELLSFDDANNDGKWQQWTPDNVGEASWGLDTKSLWFETMGDLQIHTDSWNSETGEDIPESFFVAKDKNVTINDMNITVWGESGN